MPTQSSHLVKSPSPPSKYQSMHDIAARKECVLEDACRSKGADGDTMSSPMLVGEAKPKPMPTSDVVTDSAATSGNVTKDHPGTGMSGSHRHYTTTFSFLELAAEIRIEIYRLVLVTRVSIEDLHPEEYDRDKQLGRVARTSYKTKDHSEQSCARTYSFRFEEPKCTFKLPEWKNAKTSYGPHRYSWEKAPNLSLLAVSRQTRAEAIPVFYGENEFWFWSMSALIPFLKDRVKESLECLKSLRFRLQVESGKSQASRQKAWSQAFSDLSQFPLLSIKKLELHLNDGEMRYVHNLKLNTKLMDWVHKLSNSITGLDMLGVEISYYFTGESPNDEQTAEESERVEELWAFMAPKMLSRIENEEHTPKALQKRRIRQDWDIWELEADDPRAARKRSSGQLGR